MQQKQLDDQFQEVHTLISSAENQIKRTEMVSDTLSISAINQLRYASHHLSRATISDEDKKKQMELDNAKSHATRAIIDAIEVRTLYVLKELRLFDHDYRLISISKYVPDYPVLLSIAEKIRTLLQITPDDSIQASDPKRYATLSDLTDELHRGIAKAMVNRDILNHKLNITRRRNRYITALSSAGLIISILAVIASIWLPDDIDKTPEIQNEIQNLDNIKVSLLYLEEYVQDQIVRLSSLNIDIESMQKEKEELYQIISTNQDIVQTIIKRYESHQPQLNWIQMLISFSIGVFSSLTVVLFTNYYRRIRVVQ